MEAVQVVGNWSVVASDSAHGAAYYSWTASGGNEESGSAWIVFAPKGGPAPASVNTSGVYELALAIPSKSDECTSPATNVSIVIRSGDGYSVTTVDMNATELGSEADDADPSETDGGSRHVMLGNFTLLAGATTLVSFVESLLF